MTNLEKSILSTVVYYDALDLPLTSWEIFEYLLMPQILPRSSPAFGGTLQGKRGRNDYADNTLNDIINILDSENLKQFIDEKNGFYFLKGRDELYEGRIEQQKIADQKWKKTLKIIKWFQVIPFVKMICANGSLALNHTDQESDLDIFIVTNTGRIWTTRFLLSLLTVIMGVKRFKNSKNICNKICFNHFVTDESMFIRFHSVYTANNFARLTPIYCADLYRLFYEKNEWIKEYLPNFKGENKISRRTVKNSWLIIFGRMGEWILGNKIGNILEQILKKYQLKRIQKGVQDIGAGRIIADDTQLEFHPHSPERQVIDRYNEKMRELGFAELATEKDSGLAKE